MAREIAQENLRMGKFIARIRRVEAMKNKVVFKAYDTEDSISYGSFSTMFNAEKYVEELIRTDVRLGNPEPFGYYITRIEEKVVCFMQRKED